MNNFLEKKLKVYSHETSRFIWLSAVFFTIFFILAVFRNYVDAAFLKRFGAEYIPQMLVLNALLTFVVLGVVDRLSRKFIDNDLLAGFLSIYALSTFGLFLMVKEGVSLAYPILYQLLNLLDSILLVYLWNMAGDLFDPRQGKRIFPLVTAAQVLGTTIGSFITKPFTLAFGEDQILIFFGTFCLLLSIFLFKTGAKLFTRARPKTAASKSGKTIKLYEVPGLMKQYPMVRYLIITGLIPNILLPIFFFQFNVIASHTFTSEQGLISFLSIFRGLTTFITFLLLFFVGRIYSSIGLTNSSIVQPLNFSIMFGSLTAFFNIYVACYGQFTAILIQRAIAGPVNKILYSILPSDLIPWSRTFIRGTVLKVGMLTGSLLMIALKPVVTPQDLSIIGIVLSAYWLLETFIFRKHYKRILKQVIVEKQIDFDQVESVRAVDSSPAALELVPVGLEDRPFASVSPDKKAEQTIPPDAVLKMLSDENSTIRMEAATTIATTKDIRAVATLVRMLEDTDEDVRKSAIEALISFGEQILPFLEVSLIECPPRTKQAILEVIRLSGLHNFEIIPFLGKELCIAYSNLIAYRGLQDVAETSANELLKKHLIESNEEILSLIFYALWVYHADMRLMYQALKSETASIAVELIENSIQKELGPYLIPLIEDVPLDEKIEDGKKLFPLVRNVTPERLLNFLADSEDPVTRMLTLYLIGEQTMGESFVPILELKLNDARPFVRESAEYALKRNLNEVAQMPDIIDRINKLRTFTIFEGMGIRELHAIASVVNVEHFSPGDVMIKEGEENSSIYLVIDGKIRIFEGYGTPDEKEKVTIGEGSFLGELSLFTRMAPNATCVAVENTKAYVLRHHQFQEIMRIYPQIGINLCRFFTMKLRQRAY